MDGMKKLCKVARISGGKVKWEDWLELNEHQARLIADSGCGKRKEGALLNENVILELLGQKISRAVRFALHVLLIDVRKGYAMVVYI